MHRIYLCVFVLDYVATLKIMLYAFVLSKYFDHSTTKHSYTLATLALYISICKYWKFVSIKFFKLWSFSSENDSDGRMRIWSLVANGEYIFFANYIKCKLVNLFYVQKKINSRLLILFNLPSEIVNETSALEWEWEAIFIRSLSKWVSDSGLYILSLRTRTHFNQWFLH